MCDHIKCQTFQEQHIKRERPAHRAFIFIWIDGKRWLTIAIRSFFSVVICRFLPFSISFSFSFALYNRNILLTLITIMLSSAICKLNSQCSYCNVALEFHYCLFGMRCIVQKDSCVSISDTLNKNTPNWSTDESWWESLLRCVYVWMFFFAVFFPFFFLVYRRRWGTSKTKSCERIHCHEHIVTWTSVERKCIPIT